ncbi:hypothetical protein Q7689_00120 [Nocardiopsis tropica]|uniref:hypothetical protein n=1 Tax=Nocardiopsis tropica TaxID=109330 RepID=UPI002E8872EC|nr:hypothetical protein [Nocardiopsis tropica]
MNTPIDQMTDDQKIRELSEITELEKRQRARKLLLVRSAFPETRGEPQVRGRLTEVAKAVGWTREHVANIRDGKVTE